MISLTMHVSAPWVVSRYTCLQTWVRTEAQHRVGYELVCLLARLWCLARHNLASMIIINEGTGLIEAKGQIMRYAEVDEKVKMDFYAF
jgi:hypothetical protein